jgi:hypothetical protein
MKKYAISFTDIQNMNAAARHSLVTGVVNVGGAWSTAFNDRNLYLTVTASAETSNIESQSLLVEKNVVNEMPYTVKEAQFIYVGATVLCITTGAQDIYDLMNSLCDYWEVVQLRPQTPNAEAVGWGISRVQKTDFSDPVSIVDVTSSINVYDNPTVAGVYKSGGIVGIDNNPFSVGLAAFGNQRPVVSRIAPTYVPLAQLGGTK